jgi:hypothetical protein
LGIYYVVNVLASLPAMDRERSRYEVYTSLDQSPQAVGSVKGIRNLVLLPGALKVNVLVFRLQEMLDWVLFSPSLRASMDAASVLGFEWWEVALSSDVSA